MPSQGHGGALRVDCHKCQYPYNVWDVEERNKHEHYRKTFDLNSKMITCDICYDRYDALHPITYMDHKHKEKDVVIIIPKKKDLTVVRTTTKKDAADYIKSKYGPKSHNSQDKPYTSDWWRSKQMNNNVQHGVNHNTLDWINHIGGGSNGSGSNSSSSNSSSSSSNSGSSGYYDGGIDNNYYGSTKSHRTKTNPFYNPSQSTPLIENNGQNPVENFGQAIILTVKYVTHNNDIKLVTIKTSDNVLTLKQAISRAWYSRLNVNAIRLVYAGNELQNWRYIQSYPNLTNGSVIHMVIKKDVIATYGVAVDGEEEEEEAMNDVDISSSEEDDHQPLPPLGFQWSSDESSDPPSSSEEEDRYFHDYRMNDEDEVELMEEEESSDDELMVEEEGFFLSGPLQKRPRYESDDGEEDGEDSEGIL